jgi:hypothetical protein
MSKKHWRDAMDKRNQDWINDKSRKLPEIFSRAPSKAYKENWERIFNKKDSQNCDSDEIAKDEGRDSVTQEATGKKVL